MIINSKRKLKSLIHELGLKNLKIGAISGGFDIFHDGHKLALEFSSDQVDRLFVLVNSDKSIRTYKGINRPYNTYSQRVNLLDKKFPKNIYVKINDLTPNNLLEKIRPNIYFLSQEWSKSPVELKVLSKIDCKIISHPQIEGVSTTTISNDQVKSNSAIFFDRDGTINKDHGYINKENMIEISKKNLETLKKFAQFPYLLFITTNQSGVAKKLISRKEFFKVNNQIVQKIENYGGRIDKTYYDFSSSVNPSKYRKPNIGMVLRAVKEFDISLVNSWVIGDKDSDVEMGKNCNMRTILIENNQYEYKSILKPDYKVRDLSQAYEIIMKSIL